MLRSPVRVGGIALTAIIALAALPSSAFGQATRTWVSGVGDDANPCSRTAPCKTFAGAISKTAARGEINVLDPGGFGAVTITKSISIRARGNTAGVLTNAANAINVSAGVNDRVVLSGLDINGLGTAASGVRINSGKVVRIEKCEIYGFATAGVNFTPSTANAKLIIQDTTIQENTGANAAGVNVAPTAAGAQATIRRTDIDDNVFGVKSVGTSAATLPIVNLFHSEITDNTTALQAQANSSIRIGGNELTGNGTALSVVGTGTIISYSNNMLVSNAVEGDPTSTRAPE